ncbi:hypothetical protein F2P81_026031 [Scophthalmus maximus]|uniref:Uncharacterized protein n=1 Tax=Scophthalmus maximus TaxID=52904 RepID=A0A6A4RGU2_SCOMX|nr:hypothetical protein F2P81_026031 [Scophthalmus maximus]
MKCIIIIIQSNNVPSVPATRRHRGRPVAGASERHKGPTCNRMQYTNAVQSKFSKPIDCNFTHNSQFIVYYWTASRWQSVLK